MTYIDIMAEDTVSDDKIVKSLRNKVNIATEIMGEELKAWIHLINNLNKPTRVSMVVNAPPMIQ